MDEEPQRELTLLWCEHVVDAVRMVTAVQQWRGRWYSGAVQRIKLTFAEWCSPSPITSLSTAFINDAWQNTATRVSDLAPIVSNARAARTRSLVNAALYEVPSSSLIGGGPFDV